ncbi:GGDEF domain-containing protein, partial [Candidatus Daviesbacteria bacterium]|nr:GGDEF domain-containing protein [Candidatus Daviesbacteria bacterium]
ILLGENRATTDSLTKLPNLRSFTDRVEAEQRILKHSGGKGYVGFLDLDDLKGANTRLGHEGGDELIITTAKAMQDAVDEALAQANQSGNRVNIFVGRKGGDEFLLFIGTTNRDIVTTLTSRMISLIPERVRQNPKLPEDKLGRPQTLSMGMTTISPGSNIEAVIKKADDAVYKAKALGKNQVVFHQQKAKP